MRVLGIDPSSTICGVALVDDGQLLSTWAWKKNTSKSGVWNLANYYTWLSGLLTTGVPGRLNVSDWEKPHMVCVEFLSVERNAQTTRKVSHFQAVSALVPKLHGMMVIEGRVSSARKEALGRGDLSKEDAWKLIKTMFSEHDFLRADQGGYDEADAACMALAGPGLAEGS